MSEIPARSYLKPAQLRLILEIADSGQLRQAAANCAMTQPAASRMLAEVERLFDAPLFDRQPKGMSPTEIGTTVLRRARVILREMHSMSADVHALRGGQAGSVHVGAVTGPAVGYLMASIREIKKETPEADITVDVMPSRELLGHLTTGKMDFALARILPEFDSRDFEILPLRDEKVTFCVRADHPMARAPMVTLTELHDHEWIMQSRGAPIREATMEAFAAVGLAEPRNIVNSPSILFTIAYLAHSDAIASVSEEVAQLLMRPPVHAGFALLAQPREIRVDPYYLLNLRRRPLSRLARRVRQKVIEKTLAAD
ncbi:LysR family transcriptional regulator [Paracoccus sp. PAMC 22219]|uniref:LysR family transcriptional regulator n=1 Tax=Paracoccus sp. PAMC 22219 TaxID=1569209 RepID=UPI0005AA2106|nr:LysR family transcriptional regulator [Paracoccus sp. PAMC 22219]